MTRNVFLLATDLNNPCRDVIHSRDTSLKLRVFCLDKESFHPHSGEIQLYGSADGSVFAFETIDIVSEDALDIVEAIQWYADYIGQSAMEIVPDDPRQGKEIAI